MKLIKMHGAGNDFLFIDARGPGSSRPPEGPARADWVKQVCNRRFGVGADGLAFIEDDNKYDFRWDFYNSDGSSAEMCGNAARCVTLLYSKLEGSNRCVEFLTASGPIRGQVETSGDVTVTMKPVEQLEKSVQKFSAHDQTRSFHLLDTGVPHAVLMALEGETLQSPAHRRFSEELRKSPLVGRKGANVTWVEPVNDSEIHSVSFERGVEDFTLACGTGVVAAAFAHKSQAGTQKITVNVPGGQLQVDFADDSPKLTGPAVFIAEIQLDVKF